MPPRINIFTAAKALPALRQSSGAPSTTSRRSITTSFSVPSRPNARAGGYGMTPTLSLSSSGRLQQQKRWESESADPEAKEESERLKGPTEDALPDASEEAAETARIMAKRGDAVPSSPELEQGTPVSEILQRDEEAQKHAPKVMQDQIKTPNGTRSFSTLTRRLRPEVQGDAASVNGSDPSIALVADMISQATAEKEAQLPPGLKFQAPETLPKTENFRKRYEPLLEQFTKLLMRDGKLSVAQKDMAFILDHLRTASAPQPNSRRPLLPGPPGPQLPLNPVLYLTLIVDSVAPLLKIRQQKGIIGGGAALQIPVPLVLRQRRRTAIKWILDASDKRRDTKFAQRVAHELVAVAEGRSGVWEKREHVHKLGISSRSNIGRNLR